MEAQRRVAVFVAHEHVDKLVHSLATRCSLTQPIDLPKDERGVASEAATGELRYRASPMERDKWQNEIALFSRGYSVS